MKLKSLFKGKCPRCYEGNVFINKVLSKNHRKMHTHCPNCGLKYEYELGFFWGAMYVGYAFNVALSVSIGVATYVLGGNPDTWVYITAIIAGIILSSRFNFRYSRLVLLYIFVPRISDEQLKEISDKTTSINADLN
jgi:uncharacterized protein (DUF983 family)